MVVRKRLCVSEVRAMIDDMSDDLSIIVSESNLELNFSNTQEFGSDDSTDTVSYDDTVLRCQL